MVNATGNAPEGFLTFAERAAVIAYEASQRGLWTQEKALAFVAYVGTDGVDLLYWEKRFQELADLKTEATLAEEAAIQAEENLDAANDAYREQMDVCRDLNIATGIITTGRMAKFGIGPELETVTIAAITAD